MDKIYLDELLNLTKDSELNEFFKGLKAVEEDIELYLGIDDKHLAIIEEIEQKLEKVFPHDYIDFMRATNGGFFFDLEIFSILLDKKDPDGVFYQTFYSKKRSEYNMTKYHIIIGEVGDNFLLTINFAPNVPRYELFDKIDPNNNTLDKRIVFDFLVDAIILEVDYSSDLFDEIDEEESIDFEDFDEEIEQ